MLKRTSVKRSKYKAVKTNGYASKKEAKRAAELKLLEMAGKIGDLREQVEFEIIPKQDQERACHYIADFVYREKASDGWLGPIVAEDVKGQKSGAAYQMFVLKRKLMLYVHGIRVREI